MEAAHTGFHTASPALRDLLPALQRLDRLLEQAVTAAEAINGPDAANDGYRGLYIDQDEVARLLNREPGIPLFQIQDSDLPDACSAESRLAWLQHAFDLTPFDVDLMLLALAPDLDRRYERLYAYLQDHVSRRRPSVDLALNLLCPDAAARIERRGHFDPAAPLLRHGLLHLVPEPNHLEPSLLAHEMRLDEQVLRFVLHQTGVDRRLARFCEILPSVDGLADLPLEAETKQALPILMERAWSEQQSLRLYFYGPPAAAKRQAASALAAELGTALLDVDLAGALAAGMDFQEALRLVWCYAWFHGVIPYLDDVDDVLQGQHATHQRAFVEALRRARGITILAGTQPWRTDGCEPLSVLAVPFAMPGYTQRRLCWQHHLEESGISLEATALDDLAGRFRLLPGQIAEAVPTAQVLAGWRAATDGETASVSPAAMDLYAAARMQSGHALATLAHKVEPRYTWNDIVLPDDAMSQLREICQRVAHRHRVLGEWGFDRKLSLGKGVNALFAGPSGTGKTMAAEIIANELGLALYKIDLSGVVSKYIGETEKNLDRLFNAAENANAILLFDEADALFGKRSEVRDSHDRYANIEISYLLQKMEAYDGLAILATNLHQNLDPAFIRRLTFTVHFPFPDELSRQRIWAGIWPQETPLSDEVDCVLLAHQFKLSGGNIKNIALASAFSAAGDGGVVTMTHLRHATRREYQKMGKALSEADLKGNTR